MSGNMTQSTLIPAISFSHFSTASHDHESGSQEDTDYSTDSEEEQGDESISFSDLLVKYQVEDKFDGPGKTFIPADIIKGITISTIRTELGLGEDEEKELVEWIARHARRAFATVVLCGVSQRNLLKTMKQFKEKEEKEKKGFQDDKLPLHKTRVDKRHPAFPADVWKSKLSRDDFFNKQWGLLAPVFHDGQYEYNLFPNSTLPFIEKDDDPKKGSFGEVSRIEIHPAHLDESIPATVALKAVNMKKGGNMVGNKLAWEIEANALERIRSIDHPHIITCFAAIRRDPWRYFMFPWAAGGNLREFWESYQGPHRRPELVEKVINQLHGLADALHKMHTYGESPNAIPSTAKASSLAPSPHGKKLSRQNTSSDENIRHGDLKPENLLRFPGPRDDLGTIKIGDMGMAKHHCLLTEARDNKQSSTSYGTWRYQAPEAKLRDKDQRRSRKEDVWAMGCIVLEFIIWILYGNDTLRTFNNQLFWKWENNLSPFFDIEEDGGKSGAVIHKVVLRWMDEILSKDPECQRDSAIRDLLNIVKTKLLIVDYQEPKPRSSRRLAAESPQSPTTPTVVVNDGPPIRASSEQFREAVEEIQDKIKRDRRYLLDLTKRPIEASAQTAEASQGAQHSGDSQASRNSQSSGRLSVPRETEFLTRDYTLPLVRTWEFPIDNIFAATVMAHESSQGLIPQGPPSSLCSHCKLYNFNNLDETFQKPVKALQKGCDLCKLLSKLHQKLGAEAPDVLVLSRSGNESCVRAEGVDLPVLSLLRNPGKASSPEPTIQTGFPKLPVPKSDAFFHLLNSWLHHCDTSHLDDCRCSSTRRLPTRLIEIGDSDTRIRLHKTTPAEQASFLNDDPDWRYIALSHRWGDPSEHPPFCTTRRSEAGFLANIPFDENLPQTFQDAIHTTRALGLRYLWIDSMCILQGPDGDFNDEARHMETVFSSAYCVIAASRALGQRDGFLGPRTDRDFVTMSQVPSRGAGGGKTRDEGTVYVCEMIDDFHNDVVEGTLNKRGWVLQERALAQRTIYFTASQTYFECGHGIRCETLGRMKHYKQDFMGDSNFPEKAIEGSRALKITYFQDLYTTYSRRQFTHIEDRPIAIAGLEGRLRRAYGTDGGQHGIFGEDSSGGMFHRSLLWRRGDGEERLRPIAFSAERRKGGGVLLPPSWSWMGYEGGIDYFDPPFRAVGWETREIRSPWEQKKRTNGLNGGGGGGGDGGLLPGAVNTRTSVTQQDVTELEVRVRSFDLESARGDPDTEIVYDDPDNLPDGGTGQKCVLIAKHKFAEDYWVLVLGPDKIISEPRDMPVYRRVGVGKMFGEYIDLGGRGVEARIR